MELKNTTAVVTGASTGIGRAIALAMAAKGGRVGLVGRNVDGLKQTEQIIHKSGGQASVFVADLRYEQAINKLASDVENIWGSVDIIANIAGVWHDADTVYYGPHLEDTPAKQINEVLDVNMRAPMLLTRLFLPGMIRKKRGKVINISGTFAQGGAGWLHYYVSKLALEHFTVGLADELREHQIQVNCISPSDVATENARRFFPEEAKTALDPADVAKLAIFLLSDEVADHITGQVIVIKSKLVH